MTALQVAYAQYANYAKGTPLMNTAGHAWSATAKPPSAGKVAQGLDWTRVHPPEPARAPVRIRGGALSEDVSGGRLTRLKMRASELAAELGDVAPELFIAGHDLPQGNALGDGIRGFASQVIVATQGELHQGKPAIESVESLQALARVAGRLEWPGVGHGYGLGDVADG